MNFANMTSAHFIFIPTVLFVGICIGWVLGARAARDAYAMELHKRAQGSRLRAQGQTEGSGLKAQGSRQDSGLRAQDSGEEPRG
jgi:hypothetical protein